MKNKWFIIALITLILIIIVIFVFIKLQKPSVLTNPSQPAQLSQFSQLPVENDHFKITYNPDQNTLLVVPKIPFDSSQAPIDFFIQYWSAYQSYGVEALQWLETHQLGQAFRTNFGVTILWWGQEWWPQGATAPKI